LRLILASSARVSARIALFVILILAGMMLLAGTELLAGMVLVGGESATKWKKEWL
jgi:hypothetical protein